MTTGLKALSLRSRRVLLTFGLVMVLPTIGLFWLGITLIGQDRALAVNQLRAGLERDADQIVADLQRDIALPAAQESASLSKGTIDPLSVRLRSGIEAERQGRIDAALVEYRRVAQSSDRQVQSEALLLVARVLRSSGRSDEALAVWNQLKDRDNVHAFGSPVSLSAGLARVRELGERRQLDRRNAEAVAIRRDLVRGRWQIDRVTMEAAWLDVATVPSFASEWVARWRKAGVAVSLNDASGAEVIQSDPLTGPEVLRNTSASKLPWTLRVASVAPAAALDAYGGRRRSLLLVLALAAFLVLAGAYFVARGVRRELAVAQLQSSFVSAVSHEFRTPLTSMSHLVEILRDRPHLDEAKRMKYYDALEQEADRLRRFVDRLLDFGRVDAGAAQYRFEPTNAGNLVTELVDRFRSGPAGTRHPVSCTIAADLPRVTLDRESFTLALNNLLENAAKYSPAAAPVAVEVSLVENGSRLAVRVRDEGQGIPSGEQQLIFDKFVRGAAAQASGIRGTGVGLSLARDIVRAHGGDITVVSEPARGSTFTIALPVGA